MTNNKPDPNTDAINEMTKLERDALRDALLAKVDVDKVIEKNSEVIVKGMINRANKKK